MEKREREQGRCCWIEKEKGSPPIAEKQKLFPLSSKLNASQSNLSSKEERGRDMFQILTIAFILLLLLLLLLNFPALRGLSAIRVGELNLSRGSTKTINHSEMDLRFFKKYTRVGNK